MKQLIKLIFLCIGAAPAGAQEFSITKVELAGDKVNIYYNLVDTVKSRTYTVELYASTDNFVSRLQKVSGDLGLEVRPGGNHKITWAAKEELGPVFDGKVGLEVRGRLYVPFVRVEGLSKVYKRGRKFPITWTGGTQQNVLNFDLYQGDEMVYPFSNIANVGQTELTIPTTVKPGDNYHFRITDNKNKDQIVNTPAFEVRRKVPLAAKVAPVLVVGGAIYLLTGKTEDNTIPDPVSPTTIHQ